LPRSSESFLLAPLPQRGLIARFPGSRGPSPNSMKLTARSTPIGSRAAVSPSSQTGISAATPEQQARNHCDLIEQQEGKVIADEYRRRLGILRRRRATGARPGSTHLALVADAAEADR